MHLEALMRLDAPEGSSIWRPTHLPGWALDRPKPEQAVYQAEKLVNNLPLAHVLIQTVFCMKLEIRMRTQEAMLLKFLIIIA